MADLSDVINDNAENEIVVLPDDSGGDVPVPGTWGLDFEDTFDSGSLDTSVWSYGWGWGPNADYTPATSNSDFVWVQNGRLHQQVWKDANGGHHVGNIHSKGGVEFEPPVYLEARMKCLDLPGANNAFWAKPASEIWPPEIDVMEIHRNTASETLNHSIHNLHYDTSGGAGGNHGKINNARVTLPSGDYQDGMHTFGCYWGTDRIDHYLDGNRIGSSSDGTMLSSMRSGAPFYMMLTLQTVGAGGWLGTPPSGDWNAFDTIMETDWVRVWKPE